MTMLFRDRLQAGEMLAAKLEAYSDQNPLVLAVPRGGVPVAAPIRSKLSGDLDLIITRKIGAPYQAELAIGAITGDGFSMLNEQLVSRLGVFPDYIEKAKASEQAEIKRRLQLYRGDRMMLTLEERLVILVDDGVATGYTLLVALRSIREQKPARLVLAVPVGPPETFERLAGEADQLVYLEAPAAFAAVGQFYRDFSQISDNEVITLLNAAWDQT